VVIAPPTFDKLCRARDLLLKALPSLGSPPSRYVAPPDVACFALMTSALSEKQAGAGAE
jgi:hypothetical protein